MSFWVIYMEASKAPKKMTVNPQGILTPALIGIFGPVCEEEGGHMVGGMVHDGGRMGGGGNEFFRGYIP
jgi:hypothetical protein